MEKEKERELLIKIYEQKKINYSDTEYLLDKRLACGYWMGMKDHLFLSHKGINLIRDYIINKKKDR